MIKDYLLQLNKEEWESVYKNNDIITVAHASYRASQTYLSWMVGINLKDFNDANSDLKADYIALVLYRSNTANIKNHNEVYQIIVDNSMKKHEKILIPHPSVVKIIFALTDALPITRPY